MFFKGNNLPLARQHIKQKDDLSCYARNAKEKKDGKFDLLLLFYVDDDEIKLEIGI